MGKKRNRINKSSIVINYRHAIGRNDNRRNDHKIIYSPSQDPCVGLAILLLFVQATSGLPVPPPPNQPHSFGRNESSFSNHYVGNVTNPGRNDTVSFPAEQHHHATYTTSSSTLPPHSPHPAHPISPSLSKKQIEEKANQLDMYARDPRGLTVMESAGRGYFQTKFFEYRYSITVFLKRGFDFVRYPEVAITFMQGTLLHNDTELLEELLTHGLPPDTLVAVNGLTKKSSPLAAAISERNEPIGEVLVRQGAHVWCRQPYPHRSPTTAFKAAMLNNMTRLAHAIHDRQKTMGQNLPLAHPLTLPTTCMSVDSKDSLLLALQNTMVTLNYKGFIALLKKATACIDDAFYFACDLGLPVVFLKALVEHSQFNSSELNALNENNHTVIHTLAAINADWAIAYLLRQGASPEVVGADPALHYAIYFSNLDSVVALGNGGASLFSQDSKGITPFELARVLAEENPNSHTLGILNFIQSQIIKQYNDEQNRIIYKKSALIFFATFLTANIFNRFKYLKKWGENLALSFLRVGESKIKFILSGLFPASFGGGVATYVIDPDLFRSLIVASISTSGFLICYAASHYYIKHKTHREIENASEELGKLFQRRFKEAFNLNMTYTVSPQGQLQLSYGETDTITCRHQGENVTVLQTRWKQELLKIRARVFKTTPTSVENAVTQVINEMTKFLETALRINQGRNYTPKDVAKSTLASRTSPAPRSLLQPIDTPPSAPRFYQSQPNPKKAEERHIKRALELKEQERLRVLKEKEEKRKQQQEEAKNRKDEAQKSRPEDARRKKEALDKKAQENGAEQEHMATKTSEEKEDVTSIKNGPGFFDRKPSFSAESDDPLDNHIHVLRRLLQAPSVFHLAIIYILHRIEVIVTQHETTVIHSIAKPTLFVLAKAYDSTQSTAKKIITVSNGANAASEIRSILLSDFGYPKDPTALLLYKTFETDDSEYKKWVVEQMLPTLKNLNPFSARMSLCMIGGFYGFIRSIRFEKGKDTSEKSDLLKFLSECSLLATCAEGILPSHSVEDIKALCTLGEKALAQETTFHLVGRSLHYPS